MNFATGGQEGGGMGRKYFNYFSSRFPLNNLFPSLWLLICTLLLWCAMFIQWKQLQSTSIAKLKFNNRDVRLSRVNRLRRRGVRDNWTNSLYAHECIESTWAMRSHFIFVNNNVVTWMHDHRPKNCWVIDAVNRHRVDRWENDNLHPVDWLQSTRDNRLKHLAFAHIVTTLESDSLSHFNWLWFD